jgi:hypothetical protein
MVQPATSGSVHIHLHNSAASANSLQPTFDLPQANDFDQRCWNDLVQYADQNFKTEPPFGNFRKLQIMNITHLVNQLVRFKVTTQHTQATTAETMSLLQRILHQYGKPSLKLDNNERKLIHTTVDAIRDYKDIGSVCKIPELITYIRQNFKDIFPYLVNPYPGERHLL